MGDEKDALALLCKVLHNLHKLLNLLRSEHRRRLVKDENLVFAVKHLEYLRPLLHTDADVLNEGVKIDRKTVFF